MTLSGADALEQQYPFTQAQNLSSLVGKREVEAPTFLFQAMERAFEGASGFESP